MKFPVMDLADVEVFWTMGTQLLLSLTSKNADGQTDLNRLLMHSSIMTIRPKSEKAWKDKKEKDGQKIMTCKEKRIAQLDDLKDGISQLEYRVELLNACFQPWKIFKFETREEAEQKYKEVSEWELPGYIRKYAIVKF